MSVSHRRRVRINSNVASFYHTKKIEIQIINYSSLTGRSVVRGKHQPLSSCFRMYVVESYLLKLFIGIISNKHSTIPSQSIEIRWRIDRSRSAGSTASVSASSGDTLAVPVSVLGVVAAPFRVVRCAMQGWLPLLLLIR